jgi:hypothetical protein
MLPGIMSEAELEAQLKGKTLLVYRYLLERPRLKVGVRELQRRFNFSSPSLAAYHLEKLASLGLVGKTPTGDYYLSQEVKVGVLKLFTRFGRFLIPRFLFYAVWLTTMLTIYLVAYPHSWGIHDLAAVILGASAAAILWIEAFKLWLEARSKT